MNTGLRAAAALALCASAARAQYWSTLAGDGARNSNTVDVGSIGAARWVATLDSQGQPITFGGQTTVVLRQYKAYAVGKSAGVPKLYCIDTRSGAVEWGAPVPAPTFESWASPSIDQVNGTVLVAADRFVTAISAADGSQVWQATLDRATGGATCAVTNDSFSTRNRAFIPDYDGFGVSGKLYCINLDATSASNPFARGQIVWSVPLGATAANSPACDSTAVYVANVNAGGAGGGPGLIRAFPIGATTPPPPLWTFTNVINAGFYGGVARSAGSGVLAASYSFSGGQFAANLVSLDPATGLLRWSAPCNRTDTIPVWLPGNAVVVSSGVRGFGSIPSVQKFIDLGTSASLAWDSALDSWVDLNGNQQMDLGEYIDVGGWTVQPMFADQRLFVGVLPTGSSTNTACGTLHAIDMTRAPSQPGFIAASFSGAGSSPSGGFGPLFTIGATGVHALGSRFCYANCDRSTSPPILNALDFACFLSKFGAGDIYANCDGSTAPPLLNALDFQCMLNLYAAGCT